MGLLGGGDYGDDVDEGFLDDVVLVIPDLGEHVFDYLGVELVLEDFLAEDQENLLGLE